MLCFHFPFSSGMFIYFQYKDVQRFLKEVSVEKITSISWVTWKLYITSTCSYRFPYRLQSSQPTSPGCFASVCSTRELLCELRKSFHLVHAYTILPKCLRARPSVSCEDIVPVVTGIEWSWKPAPSVYELQPISWLSLAFRLDGNSQPLESFLTSSWSLSQQISLVL